MSCKHGQLGLHCSHPPASCIHPSLTPGLPGLFSPAVRSSRSALILASFRRLSASSFWDSASTGCPALTFLDKRLISSFSLMASGFCSTTGHC